MARLEYIKTAKEKNLLLLGISEEGESARYTVSEAVYASVGRPLRGEELSEEVLSEIRYFDECHRAKRKALSLLAIADNNERTLRLKLMRYGISRDIAEQTVRDMVGLGYVNEQRQLSRLVLTEANVKLCGPIKILARLSAKGYAAADIRAVMQELCDSGEIDFDLNRERLLEKKLGDTSDAEELKKLLYKYGYRKC